MVIWSRPIYRQCLTLTAHSMLSLTLALATTYLVLTGSSRKCQSTGCWGSVCIRDPPGPISGTPF